MARQTFKLSWFGDDVTKKINATARARVQAAGEHFRGALVETLTGNRSGRTYRIPGTGRTYTASAPGEPPASRLGRLRQSISTKVEDNGSKVSSSTGTDLEYGLFLELGTRTMRPRPWLEPTLEKEERTIRDILEKPWTL